MKIKVTFEDIFNVESEEEAYDAVIKYCHDVCTHEDVTAFVFEEVEDHAPPCPECIQDGPLKGMLPNGERCDTCELYASDEEALQSLAKYCRDKLEEYASKFSFKDKKSVIVGLIEKGLVK